MFSLEAPFISAEMLGVSRPVRKYHFSMSKLLGASEVEITRNWQYFQK
jgi:hypothetical protein